MQATDGRDSRFAPLDPALRAAFVRAVAHFEPRLWDFLNREIVAAQAVGVDPAIGLLALANGMIDLAKGAMEVREALAAAGGDADVAAMILGIRTTGVPVEGDLADPVAPPEPKPKRRRR